MLIPVRFVNVLSSIGFCFLLLVSSVLFSQVEVLRFKNLNTEKGLSNNWVNTITSDDRGFVWIGTRSGLNFFDGSENTVFAHNSLDTCSLSLNDISKVVFSKKKNLFVGTWGGGLNTVNPYTKEIKRLGLEAWSRELVIKTMVEDADSLLWVGSYGSGLFSFNGEKFKKHFFTPREGESIEKYNYIQDMTYHKGYVWVCSRDGGLGCIEKGSAQIKSVLDNQGKLIAVGDITCLSALGDKLLMGTQDGQVYQYDVSTKVLSLPFTLKINYDHQNRLNSIHTDLSGKTWVSSTLGLFTFDWSTNTISKISSHQNGIEYRDNFSSYVDANGIVWLGNWGSGVYYYSPDLFKFDVLNLPHYEEAMINTILPLNDTITLYGTNTGLIAYNTIRNTANKLKIEGKGKENISDNLILGLENYQDKIAIAVDAAGVFLLDQEFHLEHVKQAKQSKFVNTSIIGTDRLANGEVWFGSWSNGALMLNEKDSSIHEFFHESNDSSSILSNSVFCATRIKGKTWLGTMDGICEFNSENQTFKYIPIQIMHNDMLKRIKTVRAMELDKNNKLWVACSYGLLKYDVETSEYELITRGQGLVDDIVHNLKGIGEYIWASSKAGLSRVNITNSSIDNFTTKDGLPSNNFNDNGVYLSNSGVLYFCNGSDIVYFNPSEVGSMKKNALFFYEEFLLDDNLELGRSVISEPISLVDNLVLNHSQNNITFVVSIQDYYATVGNRFVHKLVGFDNSWVYHDYHHRDIRYTNLDPGEYILRVAEVLPNGIIDKHYKDLSIRIAYPFWQKWWFVVVCLVGGIGGLYAFYIYRTKTIRTKNRLLEFMVRERTQQIQEKNKALKQHSDAIEGNMRYASLLQNSLMMVSNETKSFIPNYFVLYKPKDVVSGDFYWFHTEGSKSIVVAADCTGHGVSGAFMSVLGITALKTIVEVNKVVRPDLILNHLHAEINKTLYQEKSDVNDGMDISIICFDHQKHKLEVAAAMSSIYIVNSKGLTRMKGDPFPIGGSSELYSARTFFTLNTVDVIEKTKVYLFSDGYKDQTGGEHHKKFMRRKFINTIYEISTMPLCEQQENLEQTLNDWMGDEEQVDDILVVGLELG